MGKFGGGGCGPEQAYKNTDPDTGKGSSDRQRCEVGMLKEPRERGSPGLSSGEGAGTSTNCKESPAKCKRGDDGRLAGSTQKRGSP